jgi:hypothetical protein
MPIKLLILLATIGLVATAAEAATPAATTASSFEAAEAGQTAVWTPRKLLNFSPPLCLRTRQTQQHMRPGHH